MKNARAAVSIVLSVLLLNACATGAPIVMPRYVKPNATQAEFMRDRYECLQESMRPVSDAYVNRYGGASRSSVVADCGVWRSCLGARGYQPNPKGNLAAPPSMIVLCR